MKNKVIRIIKISILLIFLSLTACRQMTVLESEYDNIPNPGYQIANDGFYDDATSLSEPVNLEIEPITNEFCGIADPDFAIILNEVQALDYLALVNRCFRVSGDYVPSDLRVVNVDSVNVPASGVHELRNSAASALEMLFDEANKSGLQLLLSSAYRSYDLQSFFHNLAISNAGGDIEKARRVSAIPGHSEHQLGLAADLTIRSLESVGWLSESFAETEEGKWVKENAHRFGFIISFPQGRESDVAIIYEPWHIRFVGVEAATEIFENQQILEEYLWFKR